MKKIFIGLLGMVIATMFINAQITEKPPETKRIPVKDTVHGFQMTDYYRWLEDKTNPDVKKWSQEQTDYAIKYISNNFSEVKGLKEEIRKFLDRDVKTAPFFKGNREFFYAKKKGEEQYKLFTIYNGKDILIFDPTVYDKTGKAAITGLALTRDGNKAAVGIQYKGNEISEYRIIDTKSGKVFGEPIEGLDDFSWTKDEEHAYISVRTREMIEKQIPVKTFLHKIGDDRKNDIFLIAPKDAKNIASVWDPDEGDVTLFSEGDFYSNAIKIRKAGTFDEPKVIYSSDKYRTDVTVKNGKIYYYTNYEAPNYKLMVADLNEPEFANAKTIIPEKETMLQSYVISSDFLIIQDKMDALSKLSAYDLNGKFIKQLELPELGNVGGMSYHKETNTVFVSLNTFNAPSVVYKLDGKTLKWEFFYQDKPPIDTKEIESKEVFYYSKDSTKVPMFIVYKKGTKLDGSNPALLTGYGGFNISMSPSYVGLNASFINRGGVLVITCLRGGDEYGENWHKNGMLHKKQNTFDDFIAAAEYLINEKYTNPDKLAIRGGSNGGLLMGAVMTQRPDLFKAVFCGVPLLDMLRYNKFLIARYWIPEYGDPDKKEDFLYLLKYSPYHKIRSGFNYPATFFKAGENDARVDPLHAKKFAAALQNNPGQTNPVLLYIDFESGHGSGQSIEQQVENISREWRFLMGELGVK
jgi:prolyl oligopeptidase